MALERLGRLVTVSGAQVRERQQTGIVPVKTIYTTIKVPVTIVQYVDKKGAVVTQMTFIGSAEVAREIAAGVPISIARIEDIVRALELAAQLGINYRNVLFSYVPPPPPWKHVNIPPPPSDPRLRRIWEKNVSSILRELASVDARRRWIIERLNQLKPQLVDELTAMYGKRGVELAEKVISKIMRQARLAMNVWQLHKIEEELTLDNLVKMAEELSG